jgi:FAD/FMN-containing dehydrogenase
MLTDPEVKSSYERDWTGRYSGPARIVVRPGSVLEVAAVLECCRSAGVAVVPQGGNTGMVGGGVPRDGEVVLSLRRLSEIGAVEAGVGQAARSAGEDAGLDFGARDSCTIGGVVACDAGGARALRYGTARARVAGLEAVLADGSMISRMAGLPKDNAGYDLSALLIGSEGTLGVITGVRWKLVPRLTARVAALVPVQSIAAATELLAALRSRAPSLESCDFFLDEGLELVEAYLRRRSPLERRAPFYVLAECADRDDPTDELADALSAVGADDAVIADDSLGRERLWALREHHAEAINAAGVPHKLDVGVPLERLDQFLARAPEVALRAGGERVILFGHLGDGNVHVNVLGADPGDGRVDEAVLSLVLECGGTISAEHGVGVAKAAWLERARGSAEAAAMRAIKHALDPECRLNPGAILPLRGI